MFIETRLPTSVSFGSSGGALFRTDIAELASGAEQRNASWDYPLGKWELGLVTRPAADFDAIKNLFRVAQGKAHGFRFKDFTDFQCTSSQGVIADSGGSPSVLMLYRRYTVGSSFVDRRIQKPVSGTVTFTGSGTYSLDYTTGIVTVLSGSQPTAWAGQYDVPVRFDTDHLSARAVDKAPDGTLLLAWDSVPIVEIRIPV